MQVLGRVLAPALRLPLLGPQFLRLTGRSVSLSRAWQVLLLLPLGIQDPVVRAWVKSLKGKYSKLTTPLKLSPCGSDPEQGKAHRWPGGKPRLLWPW